MGHRNESIIGNLAGCMINSELSSELVPADIVGANILLLHRLSMRHSAISEHGPANATDSKEHRWASRSSKCLGCRLPSLLQLPQVCPIAIADTLILIFS